MAVGRTARVSAFMGLEVFVGGSFFDGIAGKCSRLLISFGRNASHYIYNYSCWILCFFYCIESHFFA